MNEQAQNALLKTLEEPPGQARLILVSASASRLLPTIRSRCQRVAFDLLPPAFVEQQLVALAGVDAGTARTLAGLAQGRLGTALRWNRVGLPVALAEVGDCLAQRPDALVQDFAAALVEIANGLAVRAIELLGDDADKRALPENSEDSAGPTFSKATGKTIPTDDFRDALKLVFMLVAAVYRDAARRADTPGRAATPSAARARRGRASGRRPVAGAARSVHQSGGRSRVDARPQRRTETGVRASGNRAVR